ncbi:TPA: tRNA pseudouridine(13) synthase TruD [Candidatus Geothermarchaeota archaeon]|nr:tRNA pseudouridine(13) synthase TruD [Candidatus Geothermarchaeota archaeon]
MFSRSSVYEDVFIGLCYYATKDHGLIPHKIKNTPSSFKVEEIIDNNLVTRDGDIYIYRIKKRWGISSSFLSKILSKYGAITLGRKDKYADAIQYILSKKRIKKRGFDFIGSIPNGLKPHDLHIGNRFEIKVKIEDDGYIYRREIEEIIYDEIIKNDIPNYYSYQRFGKRRINHLKGYNIIKEIAEKAKNEINSKYVDKHGGKYIVTLLLNSFQAYIFNNTLNLSIKKDGRLPRNVTKITIKNIRGYKIIEDAFPIIGYGLTYRIPELEEVVIKIGFTLYDIKRILYNLRFVGIDLYGDLRITKIFFLERPEIEFDRDTMNIKFSLPRGQYATQVLREILKPRYPSSQGY